MTQEGRLPASQIPSPARPGMQQKMRMATREAARISHLLRDWPRLPHGAAKELPPRASPSPPTIARAARAMAREVTRRSFGASRPWPPSHVREAGVRPPRPPRPSSRTRRIGNPADGGFRPRLPATTDFLSRRLIGRGKFICHICHICHLSHPVQGAWCRRTRCDGMLSARRPSPPSRG